MRKATLATFASALCSVALATDSGPVHDIEIIADVPSVAVAPRRSGRVTLQLPSLIYALSVTLSCDHDWKPDAVSINVADSRVSLTADQLQSGESLQLELRVPSNQIAPLRLEQFCISDEQGSVRVQDRMSVPSVLSAQASIRCTTGSAQSIRYVSVPLDVSLECIADPVQEKSGKPTGRRPAKGGSQEKPP